MQSIVFEEYRLEHVFGAVTPEQADAVVRFWLDHGALAKPEVARSRAPQAAWIARNGAGEIVSVATLYTADFGDPPRPHYHYRTFIRPADRRTGLATAMVIYAREALADAHKPEQPEQGLVIETENEMLMQAGMRQYLKSFYWMYQGRNAHGMDVWRLDWERMRPPQEWHQKHGGPAPAK